MGAVTPIREVNFSLQLARSTSGIGGPRLGLRKHLIPMYTIIKRLHIRPGKMPAINNFPTEIPARLATIIAGRLGGMRGPKVPPAIMLPAAKSLS